MRQNKCVPILDIDPIMERATPIDHRASFRVRDFPTAEPPIRGAWFFMRNVFPLHFPRS